MENQQAVGERVLADNSENFALVNDNINTADTYNIDNIVTTTAKVSLAHKESVAEGFSDSLFAKLLGVGHRFSSDIQGRKLLNFFEAQLLFKYNMSVDDQHLLKTAEVK